MNVKKILATTLVATMVLGSSVTAYAYDDQTANATGTAKFEGYAELGEIVKVTVPTAAVFKADTFGFTMDPQGLLTKATDTTANGGDNSQKYTDGEGAVYFANAEVKFAVGDKVYIADGGNATDDITSGTLDSAFFAESGSGHELVHTVTANDSAVLAAVKVAAGFSNTSDSFSILNKSSFPVDISVKVEVTKDGENALDKISLVESSALATTETPALYIGVIKDTDTAVAITSSTNKVDATVPAVPLVAEAVKFTVGDTVYIADGADNSAAITSGVLGTDFFAESTTGYTKAHTVASGDANVLAAVKVAAITDGYELKTAKTKPEGTELVASPSGYYYWYELTAGYTAPASQTATFKLTAACNNVEGWKSVSTTAASAKVTYTIKKHVDGPTVTLTADGVKITGLNKASNGLKVSSGVKFYGTKSGSTDLQATVPFGTLASFSIDDSKYESDGTVILTFTAKVKSDTSGYSLKISFELEDGTVISSNTVVMP